MTNNDILRRVRYSFDFDDSTMMKIFTHAGYPATRAEISDWLKKEDDEAFVKLNDRLLATFLNGLIIKKRGKKDGATPVAEARLNNNMIFMKLKIALNLKAEDVLELLALADFKLSKHELSAFFRKPGHKHYRDCKDQVMRHFLRGIQLKYRDVPAGKPEFKWPD